MVELETLNHGLPCAFKVDQLTPGLSSSAFERGWFSLGRKVQGPRFSEVPRSIGTEKMLTVLTLVLWAKSETDLHWIWYRNVQTDVGGLRKVCGRQQLIEAFFLELNFFLEIGKRLIIIQRQSSGSRGALRCFPLSFLGALSQLL